MRRLAAVASLVLLLTACGCSGDGGAGDAETEATARKAAEMWLSALWRNDIDTACARGKPATPPLGGCGEWVHEVYVQTLNPDSAPLTSLTVGKLKITAKDKHMTALLSSDDVVVNGQRLSDAMRRPNSGRAIVEYVFTEWEPGIWTYSSHSTTWRF